MEEVNLKTWEEFEEHQAQLYRMRDDLKTQKAPATVSKILFRGQTDSAWKLETTLDRFVENDLSFATYYRIILAAKSRVETFTEKAWSIPSLKEYKEWLESTNALLMHDLPGCEYMVYLRHHGFPSPFLDWSESPYVAAYFAFNKVQDDTRYVSIYAFMEYTGNAKLIKSGDDPTIRSIGEYLTTHKRHFLQQSKYTVCIRTTKAGFFYGPHEHIVNKGMPDQDKLWKYNIPATEKKKVLALLNRYNINAFSLFGSEESLMEMIAIREFLINERYLDNLSYRRD